MKRISINHLQNNYGSVLEACKSSEEPIILTSGKNCDLVIMDIDTYFKREQNLNAQAMVLESYAKRLAGGKEYSLEESTRLILDEINKNLS